MLKKPNTSLAASSVLYVGQVPYDWDEAIIKSVVCGSGKVVDIRLGFDYAGKNKGFCFVEYQTPQDAQIAMHLLNQVKLMQPGGQYKKLRIELSKEGLRSNANGDTKPILALDRSRLPHYVQLPKEMMMNGSPVLYSGEIGNQAYNNGIHNQNQPQFQRPMGGIQNQAVPMPIDTINNRYQQKPYVPLETPDKINEVLSQIPPLQLIELVANLKGILSSPNASRASEIFQISPQLAATISQALLLMGFIDSDVIQESMKSSTTAPVNVPATPQNIIPQNSLPQVPKFNQNNDFNRIHQNQPHQSVSNKWSNLPPQTVAKLSALSSEEAELIYQVLSLPQNQISSLPPDKQAMVMSIRSQYL